MSKGKQTQSKETPSLFTQYPTDPFQTIFQKCIENFIVLGRQDPKYFKESMQQETCIAVVVEY